MKNLMKKRSLLKNVLVPALVLAMQSCGSEEALNPINEINFSRPAGVMEELGVSQIVSNGREYNFHYGSDGRIKEVSGFFQSEENEEGISYKLTEDYTLVYAEDKLSEVNREFTYTRNLADGTQESEGGTNKVTYLYNEKDLVEEVQKSSFWKYIDNHTSESHFSYQYEYNKDNKVVKITDFTGGVKNADYSTLEWSGGKVVKQTYFYEPEGEGQRKLGPGEWESPGNTAFLRTKVSRKGEIGAEFIFSEYDDKINPMMLLAILNGGSSGTSLSENNAGKQVKYNVDENGSFVESEVTTQKLTYDSKGRPVHYKISYTIHELNETYEGAYSVTYRD